MSEDQDNKVVRLDTITTLDLPARQVLEEALKEEFDDVVIIGKLEDGDAYYSTNRVNVGDVLLMLERFKLAIIEELE